MTKHRIATDKVVVEDDRRNGDRRHLPVKWHQDAVRRKIQRRTLASQKHKIICVPVEPQPVQEEGQLLAPGYSLFWNNKIFDFKYFHEQSPFHPDDTLILTEEWMDVVLNPEGDGKTKGLRSLSELTCSQGTISMAREGGDLHPASTMPDHLGQQYNVVKVLGVEEKMMSPDPLADGMWHWILLVN